jgi:hypothetical protein
MPQVAAVSQYYVLKLIIFLFMILFLYSKKQKVTNYFHISKMSYAPSLPSSADCKEFKKLFSAAIQLNYSPVISMNYSSVSNNANANDNANAIANAIANATANPKPNYEVKSDAALNILKEKFPWFNIRRIARKHHYAEGDCLCDRPDLKPCVCYHYVYFLPDEWSIQVDEIRD